MPYDVWKSRDPFAEEMPSWGDEPRPGEDHYEAEVEARGKRAHAIEAAAQDHGLGATVGPDTVYMVGPYDKVITLLMTTVGMSHDEAMQAMSPVVKNEAHRSDYDWDKLLGFKQYIEPETHEQWMEDVDELLTDAGFDVEEAHEDWQLWQTSWKGRLTPREAVSDWKLTHDPIPQMGRGAQEMGEAEEPNPVLDDTIEMRDEKHADPSGREWSSGLDEHDDEASDAYHMEVCEECQGVGARIDPVTGENLGPCEHCDGLGHVDDEPFDHYSDGEPLEPGWNERTDQATAVEGANQFDKFMDGIVLKENASRKADAEQDTPQRAYVKKYRETALNRTKVGGKQ